MTEAAAPNFMASLFIHNMAGNARSQVEVTCEYTPSFDFAPSDAMIPFGSGVSIFGVSNISPYIACTLTLPNRPGRDCIVDFSAVFGLYCHATVRQSGSPNSIQITSTNFLPVPTVSMLVTTVADVENDPAGLAERYAKASSEGAFDDARPKGDS